jgi:hypothetical protein
MTMRCIQDDFCEHGMSSNFRYREQNFFTSWATLNFSRITLLHAIIQLVDWLLVGLISWSVSQSDNKLMVDPFIDWLFS